ncbi:hypothetical protein MHM95_16415 [Pseudoalteromonas sp. CnMc7-15]|uniref:hypothetical protein n=1 Tax=unclassified Pseudoalteromonas TaxID=194690 RepID=UPI001EF72A13|nr:hypothetical protein [Pseudoalteromonas sp. CnMc7-15]MCG7567857.1 hypothetical protein [Pseudoalteromonas sp. CnMc7-15]
MANRSQLYEYRGNRCSQCGKSVKEMVARYRTFNRMFEFHHVDPSEKHPQYSALMNRTLSAEQIEEVDKCVLLCRECHGIVHAQNIDGSIEIKSRIDNREVVQNIAGWFVVDGVDKTLTFISNDRILLQPCLVTIGAGEPAEYFVLELMQEDRMLNWLHDLEAHHRIEVISAADGTLLLEIVSVAEKLANVRMALGFPLLAMEFDVTEGDSSYLWLRNGMVLTKEGKLYCEGEISFPLNIRV